MSGDRRLAKQAVGRPLDGGVRRQAPALQTRAGSVCARSAKQMDASGMGLARKLEIGGHDIRAPVATNEVHAPSLELILLARGELNFK